MSVINKIAVFGLAGIGAVIAVAGMSTTASAETVRDTCHGQVTVGDIVVNPGERERDYVELNNGWIRWFCDNGAGRVEYKENCMDGGDTAAVEIRLREDGGLRIICN